MLKNSFVLRDIVLFSRLWIFCHFIGCHTNFLDGCVFVEDEQVVLSGIGIVDRQLDGLSSFDSDRCLIKHDAFGNTVDYEGG